jgi:quercetin dioxygenase-like cupin family protein
MIKRCNEWSWEGVEWKPYKDNPGSWQYVNRQNLFSSESAAFETRYFEVAPGGYTSHEHHEHEHCVVVIRGQGEVKLNGEWHPLHLHDLVRVPPFTPHQFRTIGSEPFGMLCVVDKVRDRPVLVDTPVAAETSK